MKPTVVRAAVAALCMTMLVATRAAIAATGERVTFPSLDIDAQTGVAIPLTGLFFTAATGCTALSQADATS